MALEDIQKAIKTEALAKAEEILAIAKTEVSEIEKKWGEKFAKRKKEILAAAQVKANQRLQQSQFLLQSQAQSEILSQKQKLIERVYNKALDKLKNLDDNSYIALMEELIKQLPPETGSIHSTKGRENLLKKAAKNSKTSATVSDETVLGSGGFVYRSKNMEIDNRFEALVANARDKTILDVSKLLFTENS